ncbi:cell adhesion molecule Dscam1-like [Mytilus edulis]|uniref:cell adhesion molecule Dscam1-like n=1 Tax=Mytilus edulis TaxID=6550 RepID=UPI0039F04BED
MEVIWTCNSLHCFLLYSFLTAILSQDSLSPGPIAYLISGSNVTFTCITSNDWNLTYFYDYGLMEDNFARVIYQRNSTFCRPLFIDTHIGVDKYTALPCSVGRPISITIRYINSSYHNKTIACRPDQGKLITTTVKIREMLTSPEIDPRGVSTIEDGAVFSFKCTAKSIPKSSIEWYIGGSKLNGTISTFYATENTVVSTISYMAKKEHNNKILFCSANDSFTAMNSSSATLNIEYVPTVHIDPGVNPYIVYAGQQNVTLACIVDGANPADSINFHWTNVVGISSDQTIILANISNIHSGEYRCKAENKVGNSSVTSKLLMVQYAAMIENISDVIILEGDNLQLHPTVDANPAPVSFWWSRHNDANFRVNGSNLKVNVIQREATANYTFHVMNILTPSGISAINRTSRKTIHIDVQYFPNVHMEPEYNPYILYQDQQNVVLSCVIDDANPADIIAYHWNSPRGTINSHNINIATVKTPHSGQYSCTATNIAGTSNVSTKQVDVHYGPQLLNIVNQYDIMEGDDLIVSPLVDSNPVHGLIWWTRQNDTNFRHDSSELKINKINRTSSDNYTCYAMNTITPSGMAEMNKITQKTFYVNVQFKPFADYSSPYSSLHITAKKGGTLLIKVTITANPTPNIEWSFQAEADFGSCNFSTLLSNTTTTRFRTSSFIAFDSVQISNFGDYTFTAKNSAGNFVRRFFVTEEVDAIPPSLEYVVCKSTTAIVMWKLISNGDRSLKFYVQYGENGRNIKSEKLQQDYTNQLMAYTVNGLNPNRKYTFSILAVNLLTESKSRTVECLTDVECFVACSNKEACDPVKEHPVMFQVGLAMLIVGLLFLTFVAVFVVCNSFKHSGSTKSDDNKEQTSNTILRSVENMPEFESRPPQEQRMDSEYIAEANTYDEMPTLPKGN